jgi:hypothetical protein
MFAIQVRMFGDESEIYGPSLVQTIDLSDLDNQECIELFDKVIDLIEDH